MRDRGFTLVEVMIAMAILTIALLGVAAATAIQNGGIAGTFPFGQAAVTRGYYLSTATMLAQDRLEQVKRVSYKVGDPDPFAPGNPPPNFAPEGFGTIPVGPGPDCPCYQNFSRQVSVKAGPTPADTKEVTVTVAFTLPTERGANQESMKIITLVAARP